jgi:hypothetical protein
VNRVNNDGAAQAPSSLLIIGGTKAGKTHYGGQLLRRLEAKKHLLKILRAPSDLSPFQEVLESLALGRSAGHTPTSVYRESVWDVRVDAQDFESQLVWPDYGGEQIEDIVKRRQVSEPWVQRIRQSNGWLFFVRLSTVCSPEDILERPRGVGGMLSGSEESRSTDNITTSAADQTTPSDAYDVAAPLASQLTLSTQAGLVELLQALLFVKHVGSNRQLQQPPLVVVLSCWDEIGAPKKARQWENPGDVLKRRLPLLSQFIESIWHYGQVEILGLSSLGKALKDDVSDEEFMDDGPERQGSRSAPCWRAAATRGSSSLALYPSRMSFRAESRIPTPEDVIQFVVEDLRPRL